MTFMAILAAAVAAVATATPLAEYPGEVGENAGWKCVGSEDGGNSVPERGTMSAWCPSVRWRGFNLLGMFCQKKMEAGAKRIFGYFPEDHFQWMEEWGFNFARLPLDYRFFVEEGDWMKPVESQLKKLDDVVRSGISTAHLGYSIRLAPTASSRTSTGTSSTARLWSS